MARNRAGAAGDRGRRGAWRLALPPALALALLSLTAAAPDSTVSAVGDGATASTTAPGVAALPDSVAAALNLPVDGGTVWTAVHLPDGATLYLRYGEPGGVHIVSRPGGADSSASAPIGPTEGAGAPAGLTDDQRRALVLRILREELAGVRAAGAGPAGDAYVPPLDSSLPAPGERTLVVSRDARPEAADSLGGPDASFGTGGTDQLAEAHSPGEDLGTPEAAAGSPAGEAPGADLPVTLVEAGEADRRVIREEFLDSGLFRTSLVLFESNRARLLPHSRDVLEAVGEVLREFPEARLRVEGHSDRRGPAEANQRLSLARAEAVREFLVTEARLAPGRIEAVGYGEDRPLAEGNTSTALTLNRRVEFRILNPEALRRVVSDR